MYDLNTVHLNNLGQKVYLFDINISYPQKLHALHNGYLLEPENNAIKKLCLIHGNKCIPKWHHLKID